MLYDTTRGSFAPVTPQKAKSPKLVDAVELPDQCAGRKTPESARAVNSICYTVVMVAPMTATPTARTKGGAFKCSYIQSPARRLTVTLPQQFNFGQLQINLRQSTDAEASEAPHLCCRAIGFVS